MLGEEKKNSISNKKSLASTHKLGNQKQQLKSKILAFPLKKEQQGLLWNIALGILLLFNLLLGAVVINKLSDLQNWEVLQMGGTENAVRLQQLYQQENYHHYFKNEIDLLEKKLEQMKKAVQSE